MAIAQSLSKSIDPEKFDLVIISERSYYIHLPGALRLVTTSEGKLEDQVFIPYDKAFKAGKAGRYIFKKVKAIERNAIKFETEEGEEEGHSMRYDWLVVCNGSRWEGPLDFPPTLQEAKEFVGDWRRRIGTARNIVIAGGGAVGCGMCFFHLRCFGSDSPWLVRTCGRDCTLPSCQESHNCSFSERFAQSNLYPIFPYRNCPSACCWRGGSFVQRYHHRHWYHSWICDHI